MEPIDSMNVDGGINNMKSTNYLEGLDSSEINEIKKLEKQLNIVYFKFDEYSVNSSAESSLEENAEKLNSDEFKSKNIKVEGNCDEWGSDEYNYALGLKRAKSVKDFLISEGVDKSRLSLISFGESSGVCSEKTKECWQKNRRVDTKLLP
jgi:peptidoglycan-associated lipoprotein